MRERTISIKLTDEDLNRGNFAASQISDLDFEKVANAIEIGLKIQLQDQVSRATSNFWWLPRKGV